VYEEKTDNEGENNMFMTIDVTSLLHDLGFSSKLKGFGYLKDMIGKIIGDDIESFKMNELYEMISVKYNSTISSISKCVSEAISKAWINASQEMITLIFGYSVGYENDCPSNAMFVNSVIDYLKDGCK
jgi:hypothetical protein